MIHKQRLEKIERLYHIIWVVLLLNLCFGGLAFISKDISFLIVLTIFNLLILIGVIK